MKYSEDIEDVDATLMDQVCGTHGLTEILNWLEEF